MENEDLRKRLIEKAKMGIKEAYSSEEYTLMQAINAYLELTKAYNLINERMEEWSGIYIPDVKIGSPTILANLIIEISSGKIDAEAITKITGNADKGKRVFESLSNNVGRKIESGEEIDVVKSFAEYSLSTQKLIEMLESYIKGASNRLMPNLSYLTDEKMAAEMLSKAGTLERLATFPASTLQLLGAEKALFKHIKYGSRPPKYGILFKLPAVTNAPKQLKGKVARAYAAKLAIALKGDFFSKRFIADQLKADLDKSMKKIMETKTKPKKPGMEEKGRDDRYQTRREQGQRDYSERPYRSQTGSKNEEEYTRKDYGSRRFDNKNYNRNQNGERNQSKHAEQDTKHNERYKTRREHGQRDYSEKPYRSQTGSKNEEEYTRKDYGSRKFNNKNYNRNRNDERNQTKSAGYNAKRGGGYQTGRNTDQKNYGEKRYREQNDERDQTKSNIWRDRKKYPRKRKRDYKKNGRRWQ
ncbi:MAG: hypothetical protein M1382_04360 [Candidatus Marsarchaeota archaeon]|nr:hypothetical protein [Candidatus Marsarchaeota archaeon]